MGDYKQTCAGCLCFIYQIMILTVVKFKNLKGKDSIVKSLQLLILYSSI